MDTFGSVAKRRTYEVVMEGEQDGKPVKVKMTIKAVSTAEIHDKMESGSIPRPPNMKGYSITTVEQRHERNA